MTRRVSSHHAFTLIELLVAVAAGALIAVGMAKVFESAGRTVDVGRRISRLTAQANLIERQMREDFSRISPDSFMVIHNELVAGGRDIDLVDGVGGRPRRADHILFYIDGLFTTARLPLHPGVIAESNAACIVYDHGVQLPYELKFNGDGTYIEPRVSDANINQLRDGYGLGYSSRGSKINPNAYASDWTLLRKQYLLSPTPAAQQDLPDLSGIGLSDSEPGRFDGDFQSSLQPAAASMFYWPVENVFTDPSLVHLTRVRKDPSEFPVRLASGLVDIVATDLQEIRSLVMTASKPPRLMRPADFDPDGGVQAVTGSFSSADLGRIQSWMKDAFPTRVVVSRVAERQRMRYEPAPPGLFSVLDLYGTYGGSDQWKATDAIADELMLSSSNFMSNCTEFIVEWSFGRVDPNTGELIWHGRDRYDANGRRVARRYSSSDAAARYEIPYAAGQRHMVSTGLIHGVNLNRTTDVTSYFGYVDPGSPSSAPDPLPWAWPKLIRVTLSLADPGDPEVEETFQFVFDIPNH